MAPFALADLFTLRCFGTVNFVLGAVDSSDPADSLDALAAVIASARTRQLLAALTAGSLRYRLEFVAKGHQRGAVRMLANRAKSPAR